MFNKTGLIHASVQTLMLNVEFYMELFVCSPSQATAQASAVWASGQRSNQLVI